MATRSHKMRKRHRKLTPGARGSEGPSKKMNIQARITRRPSDGGQYSTPYAFEACIRMRGMSGTNCGYGRNPRKALANAMGEVAKSLRKRKGSFKGAGR